MQELDEDVEIAELPFGEEDFIEEVIDDTGEVFEIVYLSGRPYRKNKQGLLVSMGGRPEGTGRYGVPTQQRRIPEYLLPFVDMLLRKCAEVELYKRNIRRNVNNTTPGLYECFEGGENGSRRKENIS